MKGGAPHFVGRKAELDELTRLGGEAAGGARPARRDIGRGGDREDLLVPGAVGPGERARRRRRMVGVLGGRRPATPLALVAAAGPAASANARQLRWRRRPRGREGGAVRLCRSAVAGSRGHTAAAARDGRRTLGRRR